jgi:hypothetical protein
MKVVAGAQSPRVNSELPNLTRQSTQRRAGVDPEERIRRSIPVRKECANTCQSAPASRTGQIDPELPFRVGSMNGW